MSCLSSSAPGTPTSHYPDDASIVLTPRSKIRALAAFSDDDSSEDNVPKSPLWKASSKSHKSPKSPEAAETPLSLPQDGDSGYDQEEQYDELVKPRGKIVSRMYGGAAPKTDDGAYERVKQSLLRTTESNTSKDAETPVRQDSEDDEDIQVSSRRSQLPRPASPMASLPHGSAGPSPEAQAPGFFDDDSDEDIPRNPFQGTRFMELVKKKRKEREEKEAEERRKREEYGGRLRQIEEQQQQGDTDDDNRMATRVPRRKAGKKALEEMHRETQRIARNMQLAHQARTKKKVTKQSLFDKFNFKSEESELSAPSLPTPPVTSAGASSPVESLYEAAAESAPGTSPPRDLPKFTQTVSEELPSLDEIFETAKNRPEPAGAALDGSKDRVVRDKRDTPRSGLDKGKGKAIEMSPSPKPKNHLPLVKVHLPMNNRADDSDSDLEIVDVVTDAKREAQRLLSEKQELVASLRGSRHISLPKPASQGKKTSITPQQLHTHLLQKSRLQAIEERNERIEELKARGVIIQTAEEREKEQQEVENLVEKARLQALETKRREKRAEKLAKGDKVDDEEEDGWFESGDEYDSEMPEEEALEFSGDEEQEEEDEPDHGWMTDSVAEDSGSEKEDVEIKDAAQDSLKSPAFSLSSMRPRDTVSPTPKLSEMPLLDDDLDDDDGGFAPFQRKLPRRKPCVTDDDDEEENTKADGKVVLATQVTPRAKVPEIFKSAAAQAPSIGISQLFAGTMASSPAGVGGFKPMADIDFGMKIDSMRKLPGEILPNSQAPLNLDRQEESQAMVPDTQPGHKLTLEYSQSQLDTQDPLPALNLQYSQSQEMDLESFPDPTQDSGFEKNSSPAPPRFEESRSSMVPTQAWDEGFLEPKPRKGRLMRRAADFSDEEKESDADVEEEDERDDAFTIMKRATKRPVAPIEPFDKKKSKAKEMMDEQAEESEDEYAGIGGASDDDDADAMYDEEMKDLLNDEHQDVDEGAMASFYAAREKKQDEKDVNKLFRDIQNGLLRKKRGSGFDLDESDDEYMIQERRRRTKRRQMAQIRKALIQNEDVEKIATDPKKAAFFKVLEDNASDMDDDFLNRSEEDLFANLEESQSQDQEHAQTAQEETVPQASGPAGSVPGPESQHSRARDRRPVRIKKPHFAEIRETLSFLGVEDNSQFQFSDSDISDGENLRRNKLAKSCIIDRTVSYTAAAATVSVSKLAFQTDITAEPSGFKVPGLLRRATPGQLASGDAQNSAATTERSLGESQGLKRGGTKSSSINFHARAKAARGVQAVEKKKKAERAKEGAVRARVGLGALGKGSFS